MKAIKQYLITKSIVFFLHNCTVNFSIAQCAMWPMWPEVAIIKPWLMSDERGHLVLMFILSPTSGWHSDQHSLLSHTIKGLWTVTACDMQEQIQPSASYCTSSKRDTASEPVFKAHFRMQSEIVLYGRLLGNSPQGARPTHVLQLTWRSIIKQHGCFNHILNPHTKL